MLWFVRWFLWPFLMLIFCFLAVLGVLGIIALIYAST